MLRPEFQIVKPGRVRVWHCRMRTLVFCLALGLWALSLAGCSLLPIDLPGAARTEVPTQTPTLWVEATPGQAQTPGPVETPQATVTLVIWLPPEFDPAASAPASRLLYERLQSFLVLHPDVRLGIRLKALDGVGGLLDSLSTASAAAPLALPDLVALPRPMMETAALKGLLRPFDELTRVQLAADWYPYANELGHLQNSTFGLPFAGDALLLAYHPGSTLEPPLTWGETTAISGTLAFPASDPQALFPLSLYLASGGAIQDAQGRPTLDPTYLAPVLDFFAQAEDAGSLPYWLVQYETANQAWEAFTQHQVNQTLSWSSLYLPLAANEPGKVKAALLPAPDQTGFTLATGWVWALPTTQPTRQSLSAQLAEYLVDSSFLVQWAAAAGYLPTRSAAMQDWPQPESRQLVEQLATAAHPYPPADVMSALGPVLKQATLDVLAHQQTPQQAAEKAASDLSVK